MASGAHADEAVEPAGSTTRRSRRSTQILHAATTLFQDVGYQNVSIDDIGAAVGLTGPAVYRHFRSKHDILVRALMDQVNAVDAMADRTVGGAEADARHRLDRYLAELGAVGVERDETVLWRRERRHLAPAEQAEFRKLFGSVLAKTVAAVAAARPALVPGQAEVLGLALLSVYGNIRDIRFGLLPERVEQVLRALSASMIDCEWPTDQGTSETASTTPVLRQPAGRRERLIYAATALFGARGFYDVRIDDIAKAAGTSVATLYQEFPSKTDILHAILMRGAEGLLYLSAQDLAQTTTSAQALEVLISTYTEQAVGIHGRIMRILATDLIYLPGETQNALRATQRDYIAEWISAVCAIRTDLTSADARALAHAAVGMITDVSQTPRVRARPGIAAELTALASSMLLRSEIDTSG